MYKLYIIQDLNSKSVIYLFLFLNTYKLPLQSLNNCNV